MARIEKFDISKYPNALNLVFNSRNNRRYMARWKLIRGEEYDALKTEIKGFYDREEEVNTYLEAVRKQLPKLGLPDMSRMTREDIRKAYEQNAPVMGVVNYIAENVGEVMRYFELYDSKGNQIEKHPVLDALRRPNDRFSLKKFGTAWAINRLLFGDAFTYVVKKAGKEGSLEMYIIPSQRVVTESGNLRLMDGIQLMGMGGNSSIKIEDVFESFDYNLDDRSLFGTSKIVAAATYLSVMEKGMQRQDTTLEAGGATHIITPKPDESGTVLPQYAHEVEKLVNGQKSLGKKRYFHIPLEVVHIGDNPIDLNILGSHKDAVTALCFVFRIPVDLYYGQSKYENAKEAKKTIYEQNAIPMANEFADDLLHFLGLDKQGYRLEVNTDKIEVLRASRGEMLDDLAKMHASLNELREANGYAPIEEDWANKPLMPMGVTYGNEFDIDITE